MLYKGICFVSDVHLSGSKASFVPKNYSVGKTLQRREKLHHLNIHLIGMKALKFKPFDFTHTKHSGSFVID